MKTNLSNTIAVAITYFNEGELLTRALEGIFGGTDLPNEVLVYDDASEMPAAEFVPSGTPVHVIRNNNNAGVGFGRNQLLQASTCDYIHFHDADDLFHNKWCETVRQTVNDFQPDIVVTGLEYDIDGEKRAGGFLTSRHRYPFTEDLVTMSIRWGLATQEVTFRRELGLQVGGSRLRGQLQYCQDSDFHVRLAHACASYRLIESPVAIRSVRTNSLTMGDTGSRIEHIADHLRMYELLNAELPPRYWQELAEAAASNASVAAQRGDYALAQHGFVLARRLGPATYREMRRGYQIFARFFGPLATERVTHAYRRLLPAKIRRLFAV